MLRGGLVEIAQVAAGPGAGLVGPGQRIAFCGQGGLAARAVAALERRLEPTNRS